MFRHRAGGVLDRSSQDEPEREAQIHRPNRALGLWKVSELLNEGIVVAQSAQTNAVNAAANLHRYERSLSLYCSTLWSAVPPMILLPPKYGSFRYCVLVL